MATDKFQREIDYIRISVTDKCNLGCVYCMPLRKPKHFNNDDMMSRQEIVRLVRIAVELGVRKVRLTGGEPLLRSEIVELVREIHETGISELSLTTNGMLLTELAAPLKEAGLNRLNISLDTMKPKRYREMTSGGDLERVLAGIEEAGRIGLDPIKINMVPIRGLNEDEIADFARMTLDEPNHIRFIEFMPSGAKEQWNERACVKSEEVMSIIEREVGKLVKREFKGKGPSRNYVIEGARGILGFISPVSHGFCYSCNRLRITAIGKIKSCLFSKTSLDILTPMRQGAEDDELRRLFMLAVDTKPEGNYLKYPGKNTIDTMSSIGG